MHAFMIAHQAIKIDECYATISDTDISVYATTSIVELIDTIQETGNIIYEEVILTAYVFIKTSGIDNPIKEMEETSSLNITIMKIEETSEHNLVTILISRIEGDVMTNFWPSHREGV